MRSALESVGGDAYLASDRSSVGLAAGPPREVDTEQLDELVRAGDRASLERAVSLATGPLLADLSDDWVLEAQEEYRQRVVGALEQLADEAERAGDVVHAVEWTRRVVELDRLSEGAHRALMRRLAQSGDRASALAAYGRCKAVLVADLGMMPSAETRALAESLRVGDARAAPAPPRPPPSPAGPRAPAARVPPMVAREAELRALADARRGRGGVALVSGEAGIGKSRLVAELAATAHADGPHLATGAALELRDGSPFGPWLELLRDLVELAPAPPAAASWRRTSPGCAPAPSRVGAVRHRPRQFPSSSGPACSRRSWR